MGYKFRKSINLGKHFRVNISKKGVGYSYGVKGFRISHGADGKVRQTTSIPGTGISSTEPITASSTPGSSFVSLLPLFLIIGAITIIGFIMYFSAMWNQPEIPPPPERTQETYSAPPLSFVSSDTIFLSSGASCSVSVLYSANTLSPEDIILQCDTPDSAEIILTDAQSDMITFSFSSSVDGVYNLTAASADGSFSTDTLQIIVESSDVSYPSAKQYIVNSDTKKIHEINCQYLPENRIITKDIASALSDGYDWCQFCH